MTSKNSLLESLTGESVEKGNGDLFGDCDDITSDPPPLAAPSPPNDDQAGASLRPDLTSAVNGSGVPLQPPVAAGPPAESLLSRSGLIGQAGTDEGGLFDDIDAEEQHKLEEEKRLREIEEEKRRQEIEEARRKQEEEQQRQLQQQQQQQQQSNSPFPSPQQQQNPVASSMSHIGGAMPGYQQQSAMMQSTVMNPQQLQINSQMQGMRLNGNNAGFYRDYNAQGAPSPNFNTTGVGVQQNNYYYGTQNQMPTPSATAGMHNAVPNMSLGNVRKINLIKPADVAPLYTDIRVTEPMLIQTQSFLISSPPYWSYQITSQLANNQGAWHVRRRFRHVVALEDRLRAACPGSILPPRPEKHMGRALEEASTQQSAEFAVQRAKELEQYLNQLTMHPAAGQSQVLRLFLGLQDDIGTAWAEVSSNALTRLGAVGAGVSMKVAESTSLTAASAPVHEWEEDAELLALCSSENLRLGAVSQAVPKLEGGVVLTREQGDAAGALGMELSKASKIDPDFKFLEILSNGCLRHGRRTKRLALEMSAAMESFLQQYKLVRYEKMAMADRRAAIQKKAKERGRADMYLTQQQSHLHYNGQGHMNAIQMDNQALHAIGEAEEIGARLKSEIHRVAIIRRTDWNASMKTIASSMKESCSERAAIWESTLESFENLYKHNRESPL
jgi:hypothetical protein